MVLTDGGNGGDDLAELELVEDGGLTGRIEPDHENPHLLLGEEAAEQLPEGEPHLFKINTKPGRFQQAQHRSTYYSLRSRRASPSPKPQAPEQPSTAHAKNPAGMDPTSRDPKRGAGPNRIRGRKQRHANEHIRRR